MVDEVEGARATVSEGAVGGDFDRRLQMNESRPA
jgi:hypothetical protein